MASADVVVKGARVFDGEEVFEQATVVVEGGTITRVDHGRSDVSAVSGNVVDGAGCTLVPGLIDAHAHPTKDALALAIMFGVTTEYDMGTVPARLGNQREQAASRNDVADIRSASTGASVTGGHPSMLVGLSFTEMPPVVKGPAHAPQWVRDRVAEGADYIKVLIDDGSALGHPSPTLDEQCVRIIVEEAHSHGLMAVAHATTAKAAMTAVRCGANGLVHVWMDEPPRTEVVDAIKAAGMWVIPTLVTMGSLAGDLSGSGVAEDPRSAALMPDDWRANLCSCWQLGNASSLENSRMATRALHRAGVPILAGTDTADVGVFGTAHGISLHQELGLLVECGLTPVQALAAATSVAAEQFGLTDRGRLVAGRQADMVLIEGDPTTRIADSLSIRAVWRRGEQLQRRLAPERVAASSATLPFSAS